MPNCNYCGGEIGETVIDHKDGTYSHYSSATCADSLKEQKAKLLLQVRELQEAYDKQKKHNGALEIAIQEAHRDADANLKYANEGWALANTRTGQWEDAERLISEINKILGLWNGNTVKAVTAVQGIYDLMASEKRKCPSTYTHSSLGKLTCQKDEGHLHRKGDVEHLGGGVKWMSV